MAELAVPTLNANDTSYVLTEWLVPDGGRVSAGDPVALIETSKALADLATETTGYLRHAVVAGTTCEPGQVVAHVHAELAAPTDTPEPADGTGSAEAAAPTDTPEPAGGTGSAEVAPVVSRAAAEYLAEHGIPMAAVAALGKRVVKLSDVAALRAGGRGGTGDRRQLSAHQRAVARTVAASHATIPSAFAAAKVQAAPLLAELREIGGRQGGFIGIPELVVRALARLHAEWPLFYATVHDDLSLTLAATPDIGVTVDVGGGLYVPVLREAAARTLADISGTLMDFRARARRRTLRESDLRGGNITLSLHSDPGIVLARPIVFPGQTCTVTLCALQEEVYLDEDGVARTRPFFHLGITYDHRVVNGREATAYLTAIGARLAAGAGEEPA
ncbi:2-oxo acid dehydrogenase subunit E2 [Plantactinospora sp. KLBMP9567]|uniref:2-oxo acid dehydrogenase subunit E2 n=1 Tax=Plantactinospora sp. KLBMP9567 TaxID=3085900 RepID=UPI002982245B|nr:2-oxo acid dehydrogenase subunit E2 [Plantactinospora sp. KLBMP9567]MDW5329227.1 2-oxo acid dehydrogenase subunit E2 [Plantactinospora sp. KLBMP9567]